MQPLQYACERTDALNLVQWFLDLVVASRPTSWTMEQVNHKSVRLQLDDFKTRHPTLCDYAILDCVNYEVPQNRRRIIAGSPFLIRRVRNFRSRRPVLCVKDAISKPPRLFIRNSLYKRPDPVTGENVAVPLKHQLRSVSLPSYTILASGHKKWCDCNGLVLRHLNSHEAAALQTFPPGFKLLHSNAMSLIGVGNAIPPRFARILMRC